MKYGLLIYTKIILGCFNGTAEDDPEDAVFHVGRWQIWTSDDFDLRCGDDGISVYKCHVEPGKQLIHEGTAWFDKDNVFNVCR